jgi:hypothetical protein
MSDVLGETVLVVFTLKDVTPRDGQPECMWMPAGLAVLFVQQATWDDTIASARIIADDVDMGAWDRTP